MPAVNESLIKRAGFQKMSDGSWWMVRDNADWYLTTGSDGSWMLLIEYEDGHQIKRDGSRGESLSLVLDNVSRLRGGLQMADDEIKVGDWVKVKKWIGRRDKVKEITTNSLGTVIYVLRDGGMFSRDELELDSLSRKVGQLSEAEVVSEAVRLRGDHPGMFRSMK